MKYDDWQISKYRFTGQIWNPKSQRMETVMDETTMSSNDEFEAMKKAGWQSHESGIRNHKDDCLASVTRNTNQNIEYIIFTRPKQKPNATIDLKALDEVIECIKRCGIDKCCEHVHMLLNICEKIKRVDND